MKPRAEPLDPDPLIEAYQRDVDRTLIRENLRLSVEERFEKLMRLQQFAEELRRAGSPRIGLTCAVRRLACLSVWTIEPFGPDSTSS